MNFLSTYFGLPDTDAETSRERVRNAIARERLERMKGARKDEKEYYDGQFKKLDDAVMYKREAYAKAARPLLDEFEEVGLAQHYYQEVLNVTSAHANVSAQLRDREVSNYGYLSKKLISVSLNLDALLVRLRSGAKFERQVNALLDDAESEDVTAVAQPLLAYSSTGLYTPPVIRAAAFDLARALEEAARAPAPPPVRGWLDFLKFRTSWSPSMLEAHRVAAIQSAKHLVNRVDTAEYQMALEIAEEYLSSPTVKDNVAYMTAYHRFQEVTLPTIAADMFARYMTASMNASRYACVEGLLK